MQLIFICRGLEKEQQERGPCPLLERVVHKRFWSVFTKANGVKTLIVSFFLAYLSADVCQFHTVLEDYDRDVKNQTLSGHVKCDHNLNSGWYRFLNISGITMPTTCPPLYTCGTRCPGWLRGDHPTVDEGEVMRTVCFSKRLGRCCEVVFFIRVKNCSSFYVYRLLPLDKCPYRYCFTYN